MGYVLCFTFYLEVRICIKQKPVWSWKYADPLGFCNMQLCCTFITSITVYVIMWVMNCHITTLGLFPSPSSLGFPIFIGSPFSYFILVDHSSPFPFITSWISSNHSVFHLLECLSVGVQWISCFVYLTVESKLLQKILVLQVGGFAIQGCIQKFPDWVIMK